MHDQQQGGERGAGRHVNVMAEAPDTADDDGMARQPLTGDAAAAAAAASAGLGRCVHPTGIAGGHEMIRPVVATALHWEAAPSDSAAPCPDCEPQAAWGWVVRAWAVFLLCWSGCLAMLYPLHRLRLQGAEGADGALGSLESLLWSSSCRAGLTCFGWGVLATVVLVLILCGFRAARNPKLDIALLVVFSLLEDLNLSIVFAGSAFALEAAILFWLVLVALLCWAQYFHRRAQALGAAKGCSWGAAAALGCGVSIIGACAAVGIDIGMQDTDGQLQLGVHAAACGGAIALALLVVVQTRALSALCAAEEYVLPGIFLFLPPNALTWVGARTVAR